MRESTRRASTVGSVMGAVHAKDAGTLQRAGLVAVQCVDRGQGACVEGDDADFADATQYHAEDAEVFQSAQRVSPYLDYLASHSSIYLNKVYSCFHV